MISNFDFRTQCRAEGIPLKIIAQASYMSESTLYRMLRHEISEEEKQRLLEAGRQLQKEGAEGAK